MMSPSRLTPIQNSMLILADIAMAAAIRTYDRPFVIQEEGINYQPGTLRDVWLAKTDDQSLRRRVLGMANAGVAALQNLPTERLLAMAEDYGIPLSADDANVVRNAVVDKQNQVLHYNR